MSGPTFSTNTPDTLYADDATRPDVQFHQADHQIIHGMLVKFDETNLTAITGASSGDVLTVNGSGKIVHLPPSASPPGSPGVDGADAPVFRIKGDWDSVTAYKNDASFIDIVRNDGASYFCLANNTNSEPPSANWQVIVQDGIDGAAGATGATGAAGAPGATGPAGPPGPAEESTIAESTGSSYTADGDTYSVFFLSQNANCAFTPSSTDAPAYLTLFIKQDSTGGWTRSWTETIAWPADTEPTWSTDPDSLDIVTFVKAPDGSWLGTAVLGLVPVPPAVQTLSPELVASISGTQATADGTTFQLAPVGGSNGQPITGVQAGDLVLLWVENSRGSSLDTDQPVVTGLGPWQLLDPTDGTVQYFSGTNRMRLSAFGFMATTAPTAEAVTITTANTSLACMALMIRVPGVLVASALATAMSKVNKDSGSDASSTLTLASALDAANRSIYGHVVNTLQSFVIEANHVKVAEVQHSTPTHTLMVAWRPDAFDTSITTTWGGSNQVHAVIGTELQQG